METPERTGGEVRLSDQLGAVKLCMFCRHCEFNEGYYYSEITYEDPSIVCYGDSDTAANGTNRYCPSDKRGAQDWNRAAEKCPAYEPDLR